MYGIEVWTYRQIKSNHENGENNAYTSNDYENHAETNEDPGLTNKNQTRDTEELPALGPQNILGEVIYISI